MCVEIAGRGGSNTVSDVTTPTPTGSRGSPTRSSPSLSGGRRASRSSVASGISPSGPIHLGNLREIMTPHLVADEIRRRGVDCDHILSWDDYDRLRRVPAGVDQSWAEHIGKPLTSVPAPPGSPHASWAEHFRAPMEAALAPAGRRVPGHQPDADVHLRARTWSRCCSRCASARRSTRCSAGTGRRAAPAQAVPAGATAAEAEAAAGRGRGVRGRRPRTTAGRARATSRTSRTARSATATSRPSPATTTTPREMSYTCACGHSETVLLSQFRRGKLVWKVDWPMRWAYEGVIFEPSGVDHQLARLLVRGRRPARQRDLRRQQPIGPMYAFVGITGMAKMSSSARRRSDGGVTRWRSWKSSCCAGCTRGAGRTRPSTSPSSQEMHRLYDEWDAVERRVRRRGRVGRWNSARTTGRSAPRRANCRAPRGRCRTGRWPRWPTSPPASRCRCCGSCATSTPRTRSPRSTRCARGWTGRSAGSTTQLPAGQRTRRARGAGPRGAGRARATPSAARCKLLVDGLDEHWSLDGLTTLVYAVPKLQAGLAADAKPTPELKVAQRQFFALVYRLLIGTDTGPRLPTLLLAAGPARVRALLTTATERVRQRP